MASEIKVDTVSEKTSANGVTIDGVNIKDSKIVTANSVDSDVYVDGSIDTAHIADLNVTTGKIAADAITGAKIADDAINSEHYTDGSIDTAHIADGQITIGKLATAVLTGATDIGADIADADLFLVELMMVEVEQIDDVICQELKLMLVEILLHYFRHFIMRLKLFLMIPLPKFSLILNQPHLVVRQELIQIVNLQVMLLHQQ